MVRSYTVLDQLIPYLYLSFVIVLALFLLVTLTTMFF